MIEELINSDDPTSLRKIASEIGDISHESVRTILRKDIKARPYRLEILHHLKPEDLQRRVNCCRRLLDFISPEQLPYFFMSDESRFFLDGHVASHNNIIWATKDNRPTNHFVEEQLNSPSVHVWCAISSSAFIGPFFFDGNVNGNSYLDLLQQRMMPEMEALLGDEMHRVIFMQDGATSHRCTHVRQWLSETF